MKVKLTKHFPFFGFCAIALGNTAYVRASEYRMKRIKEDPHHLDWLVQHERTHYEQEKELLFIFFFILYVLEWLLKLFTKHAYKNISFEREARANQRYEDDYEILFYYDKKGNLKRMDFNPMGKKGSLINRKHYAWTKYIFKSK